MSHKPELPLLTIFSLLILVIAYGLKLSAQYMFINLFGFLVLLTLTVRYYNK